MNIVSKAPVWAQKPMTAMAARQPIEGAERSPMTKEGLAEVTQGTGGMTMLASMDEVEGMDESMGQPGVVSQQDILLHFERKSDGSGDMKAVLQAVDDETGSDAAIYFESTQSEILMLGVANDPDGLRLEGAVIKPNADGEGEPGGYLIAGKIS